MRDFSGSELSIGDNVIYTWGEARLVRGKVVKVGKAKVTITAPGINYKDEDKPKTTCIYPGQVVKTGDDVGTFVLLGLSGEEWHCAAIGELSKLRSLYESGFSSALYSKMRIFKEVE